MSRRNSRRGGEAHDEVLRGRIRELQKEIRKRDQEIKHLRKEVERLLGRGRQRDADKESVEEPSCPNCGKGKLVTVEIPRRGMAPLVFLSCNLAQCEYKVKKK